MSDEDKVKKDRDPIFSVCLVVFMVAAVAVIGGYVYGEYFEPDNTVAREGSTVSVDYIGTFYSYYGENSAVVFDTSYSSVANDSSVAKSNDFTVKDSYSPLSFVVGGTTVLEMFGNVVVGHKVGDTVKVTIPEGSGYNSPDTSVSVSTSEEQIVPRSETMTVSQFNDLYETSITGTMNITSVYGWPAVATYDSSTGSVTVAYSQVDLREYVVLDEDNGKVALNVVRVDAEGIHFTYSVSDYIMTGQTVGTMLGIQMIYVDFGTSSFYITSVSQGSPGIADSFTYKTAAERYNETLYFEIKLLSIS